MDDAVLSELTLKIEQLEYLLATIHAQITGGLGESVSPGLYLALEKISELRELLTEYAGKEENEITQ